jgi:hypothetical protein
MLLTCVTFPFFGWWHHDVLTVNGNIGLSRLPWQSEDMLWKYCWTQRKNFLVCHTWLQSKRKPLSALFRWIVKCTRVVYKICGLTVLPWVVTLWKCSDGLFFEIPPLASDALLTMLHPLLENVLLTADHFEISCLRAPRSWLEKPRNYMGWDLDWIVCLAWKKWISGIPLEHLPYNPDLTPCNFWAFPAMKRKLWGKKFQSDQQSAACFREM